MAYESLIHSGWQGVLERLGGSVHLEHEARETRAFRRPRGVKCGADLLRLTLAYCLGSLGLRLTAAWAETAGLASLSNVALLKRLRNMVPWLERLVARQLNSSGSVLCVPAAAQSRLIRIVDATAVAKAGAGGRLFLAEKEAMRKASPAARSGKTAVSGGCMRCSIFPLNAFRPSN